MRIFMLVSIESNEENQINIKINLNNHIIEIDHSFCDYKYVESFIADIFNEITGNSYRDPSKLPSNFMNKELLLKRLKK